MSTCPSLYTPNVEPSRKEGERDSLVDEIRAAFAGVRREGGVSWRQAEIDDMYGHDDYVDYVDTDACWEDLVENRDWRPDAGVGGWAFLDATGFRYYLPAGMIRAVDGQADFAYYLRCEDDESEYPDFKLSKWTLLDDRQQRCVARFLRYMDAKERPPLEVIEGKPELAGWRADNVTDWKLAYDSYWSQFDK